jgi:hypothetical protein
MGALPLWPLTVLNSSIHALCLRSISSLISSNLACSETDSLSGTERRTGCFFISFYEDSASKGQLVFETLGPS